MFWNYYDCDWMPTLRLLHRYPSSMKYIQIDKGACKFLLQGAQLMAPGISGIPDDAKINQIYPITYSPDVEALAFVKLV